MPPPAMLPPQKKDEIVSAEQKQQVKFVIVVTPLTKVMFKSQCILLILYNIIFDCCQGDFLHDLQ